MGARRAGSRVKPPDCGTAHHWLLPNDGEVVVGVCRNCGEEREFSNYWPNLRFDNLVMANSAEARERHALAQRIPSEH